MYEHARMNARGNTLDLSLLSLGMGAVLVAQFFSALADNAVLIVAIAIVKNAGMAKHVPWLQEAFVVPFILLAPFSGQIADGFPKGRVMLVSNILKLAGALLMSLGFNPLLAYSLIGVGATTYSPAKYGILSQMFAPRLLVRANGMLEGSTIAAILLGVLLGGWLADHSIAWGFGGVIIAYAVATAANLLIPNLAAENPSANFSFRFLLSQFINAIKSLFTDRDARFSLCGTSAFWGSGTSLRLLLFAWVPVALHIADNETPAKLMGVVSIGIVGGAVLAGLWITLAKVNRVLLGGILLGPLIVMMSVVTHMTTAVILMAAIGFCGGLFVVPLNALLQERGHRSVGAGSALAVQNFCENLTMLIFIGGCSIAISAGASITHTVAGFGIVLLLAICTISIVRFRGKET